MLLYYSKCVDIGIIAEQPPQLLEECHAAPPSQAELKPASDKAPK